MPRLTPRRSRRVDEEDQTLFWKAPSTEDEENPPYTPSASSSGALLQQYNPALYQRRVLSDVSSISTPLSSPGNNHATLGNLEKASTLTPPTSCSRPLMVSAKRLGQDVRREHSKRRRPSSRRDQEDEGGTNLWNASPKTQEDDEEEEELPFLFASDPKSHQQYWEWCYGKGETIDLQATTPTGATSKTISIPGSWSAQRKPPAKGCLFHNPNTTPSSTTGRCLYSTPPTSPTSTTTASKKKKRVQFGSASAAEYDREGPATGGLTPMPSHVTTERYSMLPPDQKEEDEQMTLETKQNSLLLAEWELPVSSNSSSSSKRRRQRKNRRSSSLFAPSSTSLLSTSSPPETVERQPVESPSLQVMKTLAAMRMASPNDKTPASALTPPSLASIVSASSSSSCSTAADTTPPPPTSSLLDSIHSVGGALDDVGFPEESRAANLASTTDICCWLLQDPTTHDQEWPLAIVLQSLAANEDSNPHMLPSLVQLLQQVDARQNGILACADDLQERAKYLAMSKSSLSPNQPRIEWNESLEVPFVQDLQQLLQKALGKAAALKERCKLFALPKPTTKRLEDEIIRLQHQVQTQTTQLSTLRKAIAAPQSSLACQALARICHVGLQDYSSDHHQLAWMCDTCIDGVSIRFDCLDQQLVSATRVSRLHQHEDLISPSHVAVAMHERLWTHQCSRLPTHPTLHETLATRTQWLGRLDVLFSQLVCFQENHSNIFISIQSKGQVELKDDSINMVLEFYKLLPTFQVLVKNNTIGAQVNHSFSMEKNCFESIWERHCAASR